MSEDDSQKKADDEARKPRHSEPVLLPPADDNSRLTLDFEDLPLAFATDDDDSAPDFAPIGGRADETEPGALTLVASRPEQPVMDLRSEMRERFALDDFTAALSIAELLIGQDDSDEDALGVASECRRRLVQLYTSRLGTLSAVPILAVPAGEVRWLGLDHRGGFLLSRIDGNHTIEELCDVAGMEKLEVLKTLVELRSVGAITV